MPWCPCLFKNEAYRKPGSYFLRMRMWSEFDVMHNSVFAAMFAGELPTTQPLRIIHCKFVTSTFVPHSHSLEVWTGLYSLQPANGQTGTPSSAVTTSIFTVDLPTQTLRVRSNWYPLGQRQLMVSPTITHVPLLHVLPWILHKSSTEGKIYKRLWSTEILKSRIRHPT